MPIKKIAKGNEEKEAQLLTIPGVMLNDSQDRVYPLGAAAGHLTGYVQAVTAEDLEKLENKGISIEDFSEYEGLFQTLNPAFYEIALNKSLENLGLEMIDVYYIHIP